jgi:uncharacterized protein (TIGR02145 family)
MKKKYLIISLIVVIAGIYGYYNVLAYGILHKFNEFHRNNSYPLTASYAREIIIKKYPFSLPYIILKSKYSYYEDTKDRALQHESFTIDQQGITDELLPDSPVYDTTILTTNLPDSKGNQAIVYTDPYKSNKGTFTDSRDNKTYRWVRIGNQIWMAENLAYKLNGTNWAYDLGTYGYVYTHDEACWVCPSGWHLPDRIEWQVLTDYLGGEAVAGNKMKSDHGWYGNGNGTNESGFDGLPGGYYYSFMKKFNGVGKYGHWWTATRDRPETAWPITLGYDHSKGGSFLTERRDSGLSIRCIKD